jgi:hypothetical protein
MVALKRIPNHLRSAKAREWAKRSNEVQAAARIERGPDADTVRKRALEDARGQLVREGCTFRDGKAITWSIVRSVAGRSDQYDVIASGQLRETAGKRLIRAKYGVRL